MADRAAQLLSVVNLRILARPVTLDLKLWEYLHVLLVFMRSLHTRPDLKKRYGYAFHPQLMAPLLNLLLHRLKDRGGDAWEALFRPEFPMIWVPLNTKDKPGKYGMSTMDAQREYFMRKREQEAEGTKADNVTIAPTEDNNQTTAGDDNSSWEIVAPKAEDNTRIVAEASTSKLGVNLEPENVSSDNSDYEMDQAGGAISDGIEGKTDTVQTIVQSTAEHVEHDGSKDKLATAQGATTSNGVVFESHIGLAVQERLYTVVLPEDRLLRGFSFAEQTPSPPAPEQPPSAKQIARAQWDEEEIRTAQLKQDKRDRYATKKRAKEDRKQQKRIARGTDSKLQWQTCAGCHILAKRGKGKKVSAHAATSEACQERCGCRRVNTLEPEATRTAEGSPTITLGTVPETVEDDRENDKEEAPADATKDEATRAQNLTANILTVVQGVTDVLPQEPEYPLVDGNESDLDETPYLGLLFDEADEVDEAVDGNASPPRKVTKPDDNAGVNITCKEAGKAAAEENSTSPAVAELETDYGISSMFAQADAEASKAQRAQDEARNEEEAARLEPYFYPPGFFAKSKLDWEDSLTYRDYVQDIEVTDNRELRIVWTAISRKGFFHLQTDNNGGYVIDVPGQISAPQPYFEEQMPTPIACNDGSRVVYVDVNEAKNVAKLNQLWKEKAESADQKRENERNKQEEEEKRQKTTETQELKATRESQDTQNEAPGVREETQLETPTNLFSSPRICCLTALGLAREPCTHAQEDGAVNNVVADQAVKKATGEVKSAQEASRATEEELELAEDVASMQNVKTVQDVEAVEWSSVLGEPPMEAAEETGAVTTTTPTQNVGGADELSNQVASLQTPAVGVARLAHTAVATIPMRGEDVEFPTKNGRATKAWIEAQSKDGMGKKGDDDDYSETSDGWMDVDDRPDSLPTLIGP